MPEREPREPRERPEPLGPRERPRRVRVVPGGPMMVEGPVEVVCPDGRVLVCDRFQVALCMCRRSGTYPLCDTSHRRRRR